MRSILDYLTNYTAPSAGFSEGQLKDDPGDGTGSGLVVAWGNDLMYAALALTTKYLDDISDTAESESASDVLDSIERMVGVQNENVAEYANGTTYAQDTHVIYLGLQFVSLINSNTGNDPIDNPDKWLLCHNRDEALLLWQKGEDISGGFHPLHDFRDVTNYRAIFKAGKYNFGGDSVAGSGRNFQATGLHLDGDIVTGDATLVALLDVGGADEYHLLDIIAPDVTGTRTLLETLGRVGRVVDGTGGDTEDVGIAQEDAFQGHYHSLTWSNGVFSAGAVTALVDIPGASDSGTTVGPFTDGTNGTPRTASETIMKNYSKGVSYVLIMQEI